MEDSPSPPALSNYSSMRLCSTNQRQVCISPWLIILQGSALKDLHPCNPQFCSCTLTLLHPVSTIWLPNSFQISSGLHSTIRIGSQGEDISKSNPKMCIQAHVILSIHVFHWGPSAKEINIH
ncbi:hypothetical protein ILYODFUR_034171 [Ilyodon furcidens]|uniref:Uncharacterized protein n=1 Tax=Ilyodon furcidens TaxID=33524 RepID=A0ABV0UNN5_9TELE